MSNFSIDATRQKFNLFVNFLETQQNASTSTAVARKVDTNDLNGKSVTKISEERGDHVRKFMRSTADQNANNAIREMFMEAVSELFGGKAFIPQSVRDQMKLKDFDGKGHPLTARRIFAVKQAIDQCTINAFASKNDDDSLLGQNIDNKNIKTSNNDEGFMAKAKAAGFKESEYASLNLAANIYSKVSKQRNIPGINGKEITPQDALNQLLDPNSIVHTLFKRGPLYLSSEASFAQGIKVLTKMEDLRKSIKTEVKDLFKLGEGEQADKMKIIINKQLDLIKLGEQEMLGILDLGKKHYDLDMTDARKSVAQEFASMKKNLTRFSSKINAQTKLTDFCAILCKETPKALSAFDILANAVRSAKDRNDVNAKTEFSRYSNAFRTSHLTIHSFRDKVNSLIKESAAEYLSPALNEKLRTIATDKNLKLPKTFAELTKDTIKKAANPFVLIDNIKDFIKDLDEDKCDIEIDIDQSTKFRNAMTKTFGNSKQTAKMADDILEEFKAAILALALKAAADKKPGATANYSDIKKSINSAIDLFSENPETLECLNLRLKEDRIDDVKKTIKQFIENQFAKLPTSDTGGASSFLSTGVFQGSIREYNLGYVMLNGEKLREQPKSAGRNVTFADNAERKAYLETMEEIFDEGHVKMRKAVTLCLSMANGIIGSIDEILGLGGEQANRELVETKHTAHDATEKNLVILTGLRDERDNYDIVLNENGDVTIKCTNYRHLDLKDVVGLPGGFLYAPNLSRCRFDITITIKGGSDAQLGDKMPEITVTHFGQEMLSE